MKKLLTFIILTLMVIAVQAAGIQIDKPGSGVIVYKGNTTGYMIKWTVAGQVNSKVKIRLYDKTGTNKIYGITDSTNTITSGTTGQFLWKQNVIDNTNYGDYIIRVKTIDNAHWDDSGIFHVKKKMGIVKAVPKLSTRPIGNYKIIKQKITVLNPAKNGSYEVNKPISITWDKNFGNYEFVWVYIYYIGSTNQVAIRGTNVNNTGVSSWTPTSIYNNYNVFVEVKTSDNKFSGKSGTFKIYLPVLEEMQ